MIHKIDSRRQQRKKAAAAGADDKKFPAGYVRRGDRYRHTLDTGEMILEF
jgi:hypothetical protein